MADHPANLWDLEEWRAFRRAGGVLGAADWETISPVARGRALKAGRQILAEDAASFGRAASGPEGLALVLSELDDGAAYVRHVLRDEATGLLEDLRETVVVAGGAP